MEKVIMIPTDFSVESLNTLKLAIGQHEGKKVHAVLVYAEMLSDSITELLFYDPKKTINALKNAPFEEALSVLKNRYESTLESFLFEVLNFNSTSAFRHFVEGNKIEDIFLPANYKFQLRKNGFDMVPLIKKSKLPYQEVAWETSANTADQLQLNVLFNIN